MIHYIQFRFRYIYIYTHINRSYHPPRFLRVALSVRPPFKGRAEAAVPAAAAPLCSDRARGGRPGGDQTF